MEDLHHRRTFELRCRNCRRLAVVYETTTGNLAFVPDQAEALRHARDNARDGATELARADRRDGAPER
jgi:hypothetical protein